MMRKILSLLTIFLLTLGLAACGTGEQTKEKTESKPSTAAKAEKNTKETSEQQQASEVKPAESAAADPTEQQTQTEQTDQGSSTNSENQSSSTAKTGTAASDASKKPTNANTTKAASSNSSTTTSTTPSAPTTPVPSAPAPESQKPATTVTFSIVGPDNHVILAPSKVNFSEGDTVFDVLKQLDKQHSFVVVSRGSGATTYIEGIEGSNYSYFEFDEGPTSGWVFKQNGSSLAKSVGVTAVKDGDRIECIYTK